MCYQSYSRHIQQYTSFLSHLLAINITSSWCLNHITFSSIVSHLFWSNLTIITCIPYIFYRNLPKHIKNILIESVVLSSKCKNIVEKAFKTITNVWLKDMRSLYHQGLIWINWLIVWETLQYTLVCNQTSPNGLV